MLFAACESSRLRKTFFPLISLEHWPSGAWSGQRCFSKVQKSPAPCVRLSVPGKMTPAPWRGPCGPTRANRCRWFLQRYAGIAVLLLLTILGLAHLSTRQTSWGDDCTWMWPQGTCFMLTPRPTQPTPSREQSSLRTTSPFADLRPEEVDSSAGFARDPLERVMCTPSAQQRFPPYKSACESASGLFTRLREYGAQADVVRQANLAALALHGIDLGRPTSLDQLPAVRLRFKHVPSWFAPLSASPNCRVPCEVVDGKSEAGSEHALVYVDKPLPNRLHLPGPDRPYLALVQATWEAYEPIYFEPARLDNTDLLVAPHPFTDALATYAYSVDLKQPMNTAQVPVEPNGSSDAQIGAVVASLMVSSVLRKSPLRPALLKALTSEIPTDSFGKFLHTPGMSCLAADGCNKRDILSRYALHFGLENTYQSSYVTEKAFDALSAGTIPVVLGPNIEAFVPKGSVVNLADFEHPSDAAAYLKEILRNATLRSSFQHWRIDPALKKEYARRRRLLDGGMFGPTAVCRICEAYVEKYGCHLLSRPQPGPGGNRDTKSVHCPAVRRLANPNDS